LWNRGCGSTGASQKGQNIALVFRALFAPCFASPDDGQRVYLLSLPKQLEIGSRVRTADARLSENSGGRNESNVLGCFCGISGSGWKWFRTTSRRRKC